MVTRTRWFTSFAVTFLAFALAPLDAKGIGISIGLPSIVFHHTTTTTGVSFAVVAKNACSPRLWLALADGPTCPKVRGWETTSLFGASPTRKASRFPARTFCRYETSGTPSDRVVAALRRETKLHALVKRCGVVQAIAQNDLPSAENAADTEQLGLFRNASMASEFLQGVGYIDPALRPNQKPNVRIAVLDTVATAEGVPDTLPAGCIDHGFGIAHIARKLACGDTGCAASIATQLALPLPEAGAPRGAAAKSPCGGYGTPGDLAAAIRATVDGWLANSPDSSQRPHLILNLSLGWDPKVLHEQLGAVDPNDHLNAEELAVYDALAYAAEKGALTLAAAGNLIGGKLPEFGPILPAGWYAQPPVIPLLPPSTDTVVWAVGGISHNGQRLVNARPGSEPALVTDGDHAVVQLAPGRYTKPLTGTSVSAAVASSAAALVWHLRPELSDHEVMAALASSASDLGRSAELYRTQGSEGAATDPPPGVRRLDLSAVLKAALAPKVALAQAAKPRAAGCHLVPVPAANVPADCPRRTYYTCDGVPPSCTADSLPPKPTVGLVLTQPGANPCPSCTLGGGGGTTAALQIEIDPDWPNGCLTDPMLEVETPEGTKFGIPISLDKPLCPSDQLMVDDLDLPTSIAAARISFKYAGASYSVQSPVGISTSSSTR